MFQQTDLDAPHFSRLGQQIVEQARTFLYEERPIYRPLSQEQCMRWQYAALPEQGLDPTRLLHEFRQMREHATFGINHRRSYAYVGGGVSEWGVLASLFAAALNANCVGGDQSATYIELAVIRWLSELSGFSLAPSGAGLLTSGSSQATLTALAAARQVLARRLGQDVRAQGLQGLPPFVIYASDQTHTSVQQQANLLGLGMIRLIASNERFQICLDALQEAIKRDKRQGRLPCCVVANAGTTSTGAIDPLNALADISQKHNLWLHVDGAYGSFGWMDERIRHSFQGIERAHSLSLDSHKWLGAPYENGCLLVRNRQWLRDAFAYPTPAYLSTIENGHSHFNDLGFQVSRAPRALVLWTVLRSLGRSGVRSLVCRHRDLASLLAAGIACIPGMRVLAPHDLSTVCFRYEPGRLSGDENQIRACNQEILQEIRHVAFLSTTILRGQMALRACVLHPHTDPGDIHLCLDALRTAVAHQDARKGETCGSCE